MKDKLYPNYGLWHTPFWQTKTFYFLIAFLIISIISIFAWFLIKKYMIKKCKRAPWQIALSDLARIKKLLAERKISDQAFYLALTSLLKSYFYARFNYNLFGKTDQEVLIFLKKEKFEPDLLEKLEQTLEGLQFVKFANEQAIQEKTEQDLQNCSDIIKKTIPIK